MTTDFFSRFLVSRNYKIQMVARVGRKSAVVLSGIMEASYRHFVYRAKFQLFTQHFLVFVEKPQKLSLRSLRDTSRVEESNSPRKVLLV